MRVSLTATAPAGHQRNDRAQRSTANPAVSTDRLMRIRDSGTRPRERPDGTRNEGSVLVYGPGMDNPGLYVSLSRDKGQAMLFGARAELEGEREELVYGPPRNQRELTDRVIAALAERAAATADNGERPPGPGRPRPGTRRSHRHRNCARYRYHCRDRATGTSTGTGTGSPTGKRPASR